MEEKKVEQEQAVNTPADNVKKEEITPEAKPEKESTEIKEPVKIDSNDADYFVYINRLVTSTLSSFISVCLIFGSGFLVERIFGTGVLNQIEIRSALLFTFFAVISLFIGQFLQNYFVKIIEKESYNFVLGKSFKNLIWQILLLACFVPVFIASSYVNTDALLAMVLMFTFVNNLLALSVRESEHVVRQQASMVGMFLATGLWGAFVWNLYAGSSESLTFAVLMIIPLQAAVAELFVMVADATSKYFK